MLPCFKIQRSSLDSVVGKKLNFPRKILAIHSLQTTNMLKRGDLSYSISIQLDKLDNVDGVVGEPVIAA